MSDLDLKDAFRAVREEHDGSHPNPDATLHRALFRARTQTRRVRVARYVLIPAAAVLVASTAWAGATGRLQTVVKEVFSSNAIEPPIEPTETKPASHATSTGPTSVAPIESATPVASAEPPPGEPTPPRASAASASHAAPALAPSASVAPPPDDPTSKLFAEAHRLHFVERDPIRALVAWDAYIEAAPNGYFAPEARYNRALTLVRLGRTDEARRALEPFANGTYGDYHRSDARALQAALAKDAD